MAIFDLVILVSYRSPCQGYSTPNLHRQNDRNAGPAETLPALGFEAEVQIEAVDATNNPGIAMI
jgi:hypothetical protein